MACIWAWTAVAESLFAAINRGLPLCGQAGRGQLKLIAGIAWYESVATALVTSDDWSAS